ncbi:MAG: zinc-dependent alcohol dehydrogenase [Gaiellaceae bacterium]
MTAVNEVRVDDLPEPTLDGSAAILRVEACGICGTDARTFFHGDPRAPLPWVLGHEPVGVLEGVASSSVLPEGIREGDRVFLGSILYCGECRLCLEGRQNLCAEKKLYGYDPFPGAFAEYAAVPRIALRNLYPLPPGLSSDLATAADPFACALNGVETAEIRIGDVLAILGAGPIGCVQALMARDAGAGEIYMVEVSPGRAALAREVVGDLVDEVVEPGPAGGVDEVLELTRGQGADRVIVACASQAAQQAALKLAAPAAKVVNFAGLPKANPIVDFDANELHYKELAVLGAYGATPRQYRITLDLLTREAARAERIVTHRFPLERIAEGFDTIREGSGLKVVIRP